MHRHGVRAVDLSTWPRAWHFAHFRRYAVPHFTITTRLDATRLITSFAPGGTSLYRACLYAMGCGVNAVEALRTRFDGPAGAPGEGAVVYAGADLSSTVDAGGVFGFGYTDFDPDWPTFDRVCAASDERARRGELPDGVAQRRDVVYLSCLPWIDLHAMTHAVAGPDDDVPRISWGRIVPRAGEPERFEFGCSIVVHHALVDGAHVGEFFAAVQDALQHTDFGRS